MSLWWSEIPVSNARFFIKRAFQSIRKLSIQIGLILLKYVGPDIRLQRPWSSINNTFNFGLKPSISKILSSDERVRMFLISGVNVLGYCIWTVLGYKVQGTQL